MSDPARAAPVPRGRYAPPIEVRLTEQRRRLFAAAAAVFTRVGFADASAEAIAKEAGMSKATFYEHFANKEEAIVALFDLAATEVMRAMAEEAGSRESATSYEEWTRRNLEAFVEKFAAHPEYAMTLLVQIIGAGPRAMARRDAILDAFAAALVRDNATMAPRFGAPTFASPADAYAIIGAVTECVARQVRTGEPEDALELVPPLLRLMHGTLAQAREPGLGGA